MKKFRSIVLILLAFTLIIGLISCKKNKEDDDTSEPVPEISFLDYAVIRSEKSSVKLLDEISVLYGKLMSASGQANAYESDYLANGTEPDTEAKEILIGNTNRLETQDALSQISGNEYIIAVMGNKIVITGKTDSLTVAAVRYFVDTYLGDSANGMLAGDLFYKASADVANIVEDGVAKYTLICDSDNYIDKDMMGRAYNIMRSVTGVAIPTGDDAAADDPNAFQILFGNTSYEATAQVAAVTKPEGYTIDFVGNKIVVFAWTAQGMDSAITAFSDILSYSCYTDESGKSTLSILKDKISSDKGNANYYKDVPFEVGGRGVDRIYDAGDNTMMLYWADAGTEAFGAYTAKLEENGFAKHQSLDNNSIASATYAKKKASVHVYYLKRTSELRVITQNNATLPVNSYDYTKVCEPAVTQLGLDYSVANTAGGMGYLIRLEDGTFVVIDGGHSYQSNVKNLYELMLAQKPDEVEDIVISAWIVTHGHGDHCGAWVALKSSSYADKVTVKMLVGNDPSDYTHSTLDGTGHIFPHGQRYKDFPGCVYMKAHTGQQFQFPGVTINMLYAPEDVYPEFMFELNCAATIAFDVIINANETREETRFLFLADVTEVGAERIVDMYGEDLNYDVVQVGHHGNKGGNLELYQLCDPSVALWSSEKAWATNPTPLNMAQNKWLLENVDKVIYSFEGNYTFWFEEKIDLGGDIAGSLDENKDYSRFY